MNIRTTLLTWAMALGTALGGGSAHAQQAATAADLEGDWLLVASNNGTEVAPGIYRAGTDTIRFTATAQADGTTLLCHTDSLYWRAATCYPADWRLLVDSDAGGRHRIGWVLDDQRPASDVEFNEPAERFLEKGFYYWGNGQEEHRYIYLLSDNADATALTGMTFWSQWTATTDGEYRLANTEHNAQKVYAVVASAIPYADSVGWIEIWGSPLMVRADTDTGLHDVRQAHAPDGPSFDIGGRPTGQRPRSGISISQGRKYIRH